MPFACHLRRCPAEVSWTERRESFSLCPLIGALILLPEIVAQKAGSGPEVDVGGQQGKLLVLTLSIGQVVQKEGLVVSIWGSSDGLDWGHKPLLTLPEKYYCGMYSALLNLAKYPAVRYSRVGWKMRRWDRATPCPRSAFPCSPKDQVTR